MTYLPPTVVTAWLAGDTEVQVAGESFYEGAIAATEAPPGLQLRAVLVPDPENEHDPNAVAVYVNDQLAGHLHRPVAAVVQRVLMAFTGANHGRLVACPARATMTDVGPHLVLMLDVGALGLERHVFDVIPELAAVLAQLLPRLDAAPPVLRGLSRRGRAELTDAEQARVQVEDDYQRSPDDWPRVEKAFQSAITRLARARDPQLAEARLGAARAMRYQTGRRDETLAALVESLYLDRSCVAAWLELVDYASLAPHAPTLLGAFARVPIPVRGPVVHQLVAISRGRDRMGRMAAETGEHFRAELLKLAMAQADTATAELLTKGGVR